MPILETSQQLLDIIYKGSIYDKDTNYKRKKEIQANNFSGKSKIEFSAGFDFFGEFRLEGDVIGMFGKSLISHIIRAHNKPALDFILEIHPGLANHYFSQEYHPLYQAALLDSKEMVEILMKFGADPTLLLSKTTDSKDPHQQGLNRIYNTNSHETVGSAIRGLEKVRKRIKEIIIEAEVKISDSRAIQTARLVQNSTIDDDNSKTLTFDNRFNESSSSHSSKLLGDSSSSNSQSDDDHHHYK